MTENDNRAVRLLLVEDDEDDFVLTRDLLADAKRTAFELEWIASYDDALGAIANGRYDVCLIDYRLGEHDGLELLRHAREAGVTAPLILLTGQGGGDIDLAAMRAGAADYLVKGTIDAPLLERSIRYALEQSRTLRALRESEERYALSARGANDGLWVWDLRENEVYYSPRWKTMLGHDEHEIGRSPDEWFSRVHPDDAEILRSAIDVHLRGLAPHFEHEYRMRCRDGTYRWMLSRGLAVRDAAGNATRIAGSITDVTERKLAVDRLTHDAFHDALTQLPNRALFMDRLQRVIEVQRRHPESFFAVLFLDLDRFKLVNDSLGHVVGDELLVAVARRLSETLRSSDTVARLGGDEFAVLVEGVEHVADTVRAARRIEDALAEPFQLGVHEIFTTASIGIAVSTTGYANPQDVLRDADIAMYRAKARGKARHEVFDTAMHERTLELLQFETDLRRAVDRGELRVHYQPLIDLRTGSLSGFEALVRWQRGESLVAAQEIVSVAEETGLIVPIGEWVLRESLRQMQEWDAAGVTGGALDLHVNLSPRQLLHPNVIERLREIIGASGVAPQRLHLEVTESLLIENAAAAAELLHALRDIRVGLSLDDFGTGYSSLSSLRQFPFDMLKIDRSFLLDEDAWRVDEIVRTIASLARVLGMNVTVEGLETADQADRMRTLGIDFAQGFYFAPPLDPEAAVAVMAESGAAGSQPAG
ncbi:MAG TPA: EAL domain-containing protein, partial [Thermoanaerobaculia bacterium]|nr:EAL domain-containing protein [Thermoanaerobaculia bacterium]